MVASGLLKNLGDFAFIKRGNLSLVSLIHNQEHMTKTGTLEQLFGQLSPKAPLCP